MIHGSVHEMRSRGFNISQIAETLNVSRNRVYNYLSMDKEAFQTWESQKARRSRKLDPYREEILKWLRDYPALKASQVQDWLKERHPELLVGESTIRLYVRDLRREHGIRKPKDEKERQFVAIPEPPPGRQTQVDFGTVRLRHEDGNESVGRFISFVLSHSRYKYVEWLDRPFTVKDMVRCHENAFRFFGGMTTEMVYDQDALIAVSENAGDLLLTEGFQSYVSFRGFDVHLCRARDPQSKGKVERVVQYVKGNFVPGRRYHDLADWNKRTIEWLDRTANHKRHETTKKRPCEAHSLEKQHLDKISSPVSFETNLTSSVSRTVHKDNTIRYAGARYSVPIGTYQYGEKRVVHVSERASQKTIVIVDGETGEILCEHGIASEKGELVHDPNHGHDQASRLLVHTADLYAQYGDDESARLFLDQLIIRYPRYVRDQFDVIRRLDTYKKVDIVAEMSRLYGTGQVSANLLAQNLHSGHGGVSVATRELDPYISLMTGGVKR